MAASRQELPPKNTAAGKISILLASNDGDDAPTLRRALADCRIIHCTSIAAVSAQLSGTSQCIVICEPSLSDGTWRDVVAMARACPSGATVIVCSRHADERLWADALDCGAYDVLARPLDPGEIGRLIAAVQRAQIGRAV